MPRFEKPASEYIEKLVYLNRVSKTVKGGRIMKFSVLMVVGDGKGKVGFGLGKAAEVPEAIRKGIEDAKKNMITVAMSGDTIPHEVIGEFSAGRVLMKPAAHVSLMRVTCDNDKCVGCGACLRACPMDVDVLDDSRFRRNATECILCLECVKACKKGALKL